MIYPVDSAIAEPGGQATILNKQMENLEFHPSPQSKNGKMARFCPLRGFILDFEGGGVGVCCSIYSVQGCRSSISNMTLLTIFTQTNRLKMSCIVIYQLNLTLWENRLRSQLVRPKRREKLHHQRKRYGPSHIYDFPVFLRN